jgi:hypothetical protein
MIIKWKNHDCRRGLSRTSSTGSMMEPYEKNPDSQGPIREPGTDVVVETLAGEIRHLACNDTVRVCRAAGLVACDASRVVAGDILVLDDGALAQVIG